MNTVNYMITNDGKSENQSITLEIKPEMMILSYYPGLYDEFSNQIEQPNYVFYTNSEERVDAILQEFIVQYSKWRNCSADQLKLVKRKAY